MVIVKKFTTFRPNNLKINEPRQMYSEHGYVVGAQVTFKELQQQLILIANKTVDIDLMPLYLFG